MGRTSHLAVRLSIGLICGGTILLCGAEPGKASRESRTRLIDSFARTGMDTTPGDAMLLQILVESARAQRGVEVGSNKGFGAIHMGIAMERTGGHLFTLEIDPELVRQCRANLAAAGLEKTVTCVEGDALKTLATLDGPFDFVFLDALKKDYLKYLKLIEPKLTVGAVVVADNVVKSAREMKDYLDYVQTSPEYDTVILRVSLEKQDGMAVSYKIK